MSLLRQDLTECQGLAEYRNFSSINYPGKNTCAQLSELCRKCRRIDKLKKKNRKYQCVVKLFKSQ